MQTFALIQQWRGQTLSFRATVVKLCYSVLSSTPSRKHRLLVYTWVVFTPLYLCSWCAGHPAPRVPNRPWAQNYTYAKVINLELHILVPHPCPSIHRTGSFLSRTSFNVGSWCPWRNIACSSLDSGNLSYLLCRVFTLSNYLAYIFSSLLSSCFMKVEKVCVLFTSLSAITRKDLAHYRGSINTHS